VSTLPQVCVPDFPLYNANQIKFVAKLPDEDVKHYKNCHEKHE
jgi:hypothetical protein